MQLNKLDQSPSYIRGNSVDCPNNYDLITYIDAVKSVNLYEVDHGNKSSTMESAKEIPLREEFSFEHDSSTLCTSLKSGHYPALDSDTFDWSLECGNQVRSLTGLEAEGKVNCTKLEYGLTMVETKENESSIQGSETPFEGEGCYDNLFQYRIVDEANVWGFNYNQLFFTEQSRKVLDTMLPKMQTKCSSATWNFCRYEPKLIDTDLETKIEEIEVGKTKDIEICRIPFSTLVTDRSIFTERLNALVFPCNVEKQVTCYHTMIDVNNNMHGETTIDFDRKDYLLKAIVQNYHAIQTNSDKRFNQSQVLYQSKNVSCIATYKYEEHK